MKNLKLHFNRIDLKVDGKLFGFGTNPNRDWGIIFTVSGVLAILTIIFCAFMLVKINRGEVFVIEKSMENNDNTLDINALRETVSYYQSKSVEFDRIKREGIPSQDPSI